MLWHIFAAGERHSLVRAPAVWAPTVWAPAAQGGLVSAAVAHEELAPPVWAPPGHEGLMRVRAIYHSAAGRTIGLAGRASDPRGAAFARFAAFPRDAAPAGTSPV